MSDKVINGVNVTKLKETITAIEADKSIAKFQFSANNKWIDGGHNQTTINNFYGACSVQTREKSFVFDKDEPYLLLGTDKGANPVEYVLAGLAGCLTTSLIYHAAARGIKIEKVTAELKGDLDLRGFLGMSDEVRNGYEKIEVIFHIKSDAPKEVLRELVLLAQKRSPVFDIVTHPVTVNVSLDEK